MTDNRKRLSVEMAEEHCEDGHGGEYAPYCYRCQYFEAERYAAVWQVLAIEKPRAWFYPAGQWRGVFGFGDDEYNRRTVYFGRLVIALWRCRCADCRDDLARARRIADTDEGKEDRDKQVRQEVAD